MEDEGGMVRIAHISDSHLGSSLFQLIERREDARKCLRKAVDMAMRHSPDILVHTGDLFHTPFPMYDDPYMVEEIAPDQEKDLLLGQADMLKQHISEIEARLKELEKDSKPAKDKKP